MLELDKGQGGLFSIGEAKMPNRIFYFFAAAVIYLPLGVHTIQQTRQTGGWRDRLLIRLKFNSNIYVLRNVNVFL